ncbi:MAG TPA: sigma-70 family RNA polymerase sigma factor [Thermoanaerobaculia bacterium]|jgi:RNA polymerase sigma factor (sigma-70 family)|nr:sigma-70 family RNA polymerase sigma factor [Thermoanaerobaculia bacterium]
MQGEDAEVVRGFLGGERSSISTIDGWITRAAWPYQRRLAHRWDDVLQEIRLEITRLLGQGKFRGDSSLKTYLWRVVSHTCLDQVRAQNKHKWEDLDELEGADQPHSPGPSPAETRVDRDLLLRVLDRVPYDCRNLWRMLAAGLSYKEMGDRIGAAEGTLRVRVLRCREKATSARAELLGGVAGVAGDLVGNVERTSAPKRRGGNANDLR